MKKTISYEGSQVRGSAAPGDGEKEAGWAPATTSLGYLSPISHLIRNLTWPVVGPLLQLLILSQLCMKLTGSAATLILLSLNLNHLLRTLYARKGLRDPYTFSNHCSNSASFSSSININTSTEIYLHTHRVLPIVSSCLKVSLFWNKCHSWSGPTGYRNHWVNVSRRKRITQINVHKQKYVSPHFDQSYVTCERKETRMK